MKVMLGWFKKIGRLVKNIIFTILTVFIGTALALGAISLGSEAHTIIGALLAVVLLAASIWFGMRDLRSVEARGYSSWKGIRIFLLMILVGAVVFGEISYLFTIPGWATYKLGDVSPYNLTGYYIMVLLDLVPAVKLIPTFHLSMPIEPDGWFAGVLLSLYRIFVVFGVIASFRIWWRIRKKEVNISTLPASS